MSSQSNRPKHLQSVDQQFDQLRAALAPLTSSLSPELQATLCAAIDEQIDATHEAILAQVRQLAEAHPTQSELLNQVFDQQIYQKKLNQLLSYQSHIVYKPLKNIPRSADEWVRTTEYFRRKVMKYFKVPFIEANNLDTGLSWMQPILIQEFDQFDKHSCHKTVGEIILPLRFQNGQLEAAITIKNPPGTNGEATFCAPRYSNSSEQQSIFGKFSNSLWNKSQRADFNRMTGQVSNKVIFLPSELEKQIDPAQEKIVWFNIAEIKHLIEEDKTSDSQTITLLQWVLLNYSKLQPELNPVQDKA